MQTDSAITGVQGRVFTESLLAGPRRLLLFVVFPLPGAGNIAHMFIVTTDSPVPVLDCVRCFATPPQPERALGTVLVFCVGRQYTNTYPQLALACVRLRCACADLLP